MAFTVPDTFIEELGGHEKQAIQIENKRQQAIEYIELAKIKPSPNNFYEITNIEALVDDIKEFGLQNPLVVKKLQDSDEYEIISGERRWTALTKIHDEDNTQFQLVMCRVFGGTDLDAEILLITANSTTRTLSPADKMKQVEELTRLYEQKKKKGEKINGRLREKIAEDMGISSAQVGNLQKISNNLSEEEREQLDNNEITMKEAENIVNTKLNKDKPVKDKPVKEKPIKLKKYRCQCGHIVETADDITVLCEDCSDSFLLVEEMVQPIKYRCQCGHIVESTYKKIKMVCEDCGEDFLPVGE